jgi:hypothetical protein
MLTLDDTKSIDTSQLLIRGCSVRFPGNPCLVALLDVTSKKHRQQLDPNSGQSGWTGTPPATPAAPMLPEVHLLGVLKHVSCGGRFLDQVEVDVKHNETSHFTSPPIRWT